MLANIEVVPLLPVFRLALQFAFEAALFFFLANDEQTVITKLP